MSQVVELRNQGAIRLRRAKALADQASWQVRAAERGVRVQVLRAFSAVLLSQRRLRLAGETVDLSRELLRVARELYEAGHVPRLDALRAEVEERLAVNEQTAAQRALTGLKRDLILLMGQPSDLPFEAVGSLAYDPLAIIERALAENALSVRPDVKAVEAGLQATEAEAALVQAEQTFPVVNLSAHYEFSREAEARQHRAVLRLAVPLPVFNRREGDLEIAMARRSRQAARLDLVKATISAQVAQALERFRASRRIVEQFTRHILPQQQENLEMLREGYPARPVHPHGGAGDAARIHPGPLALPRRHRGIQRRACRSGSRQRRCRHRHQPQALTRTRRGTSWPKTLRLSSWRVCW